MCFSAQGGSLSYTPIDAWHIAGDVNEAPYTSVILEFTADMATTIGDGTAPIGVFGEITDVGKFLIGVIGIPLGATFPQIEIIRSTIGVAVPTCNVAVYDRMSIGGIY